MPCPPSTGAAHAAHAARAAVGGYHILVLRQDGQRGPSDAVAFEPEDDGGEDEHRTLGEGTLLLASGQSTPLVAPIAPALHHGAPGGDRLVEDERPPRSQGSTRSLVAPLWSRVLARSLTPHAATARIRPRGELSPWSAMRCSGRVRGLPRPNW